MVSAILVPNKINRSKANPLDFKNKVEAKSNLKVVPLQLGEVYNLN
jgi:hypothetical protein